MQVLKVFLKPLRCSIHSPTGPCNTGQHARPAPAPAVAISPPTNGSRGERCWKAHQSTASSRACSQQAQRFACPIVSRKEIHRVEKKRQTYSFSAEERQTSSIQLLNFLFEESVTGEHHFHFPPSYQAGFCRCAYDFQSLK